jgi:glutaredoxin
MARLLAWLLVVAACSLALGCDRTEDGTAPAAEAELPELTITESTPKLMLTWLDDKGDAHVEVRPGDVPVKGRDLVRVVVSDSEHGTRDPIYVVDLNRPDGSGQWTARAMSRSAWEGEIAKRREAFLASVRPAPVAPPEAPRGDDSGEPAPAAKKAVIIYGADWCRPCHDAADYLKAQGITVIMKDIEKTPSAQAEMRQKLVRAGRSGASIPVIDVGGEILVGFDRASLDRALRRMRGSTVL